MVYGVVKSFQKALQQRGGWRGLLEHMYSNGDFPFKFGTLMGTDAGGNRYYENRVDYPFGQHRWVEPGDIHNFDSTSIAPEWHGWMTSMNDTPPDSEAAYFDAAKKNTQPLCNSHAPDDHAVGYQNPVFNFHHMHNQSQVRSRGYGIGNAVVGLPPGAPDGYYTQPGSPYNTSSRKKLAFVGDLDEGNTSSNVKHRKYKDSKWADRLRTPEEREAYLNQHVEEQRADIEAEMSEAGAANRRRRMSSRGGGTLVG